MRVTLLETEGRGGTAEIEVDGHRLTVVDAISPVGEPRAPGPIDDARLEVVAREPVAGGAPAESPPPKALERERGWRYRGCGVVVSSHPLRADLGPVTLELGNPAHCDLEPGTSLTVAIDRIILSRASS